MQLSEQLARSMAAMGRAMHDLGSDLPRSDYLVLVRLATSRKERTTCRPRDLASAEGLDPSTMSRRIASLVERGLVERSPDPEDRRAHLLHLTDAGVTALKTEKARRIRFVTDSLADWDEHDRAELARLLGRLSDTLDARRAQRQGRPTSSDQAAPEASGRRTTTQAPDDAGSTIPSLKEPA